MTTWNEHIPIYVQIAQRVTQSIVDGTFPEDQAVPSVRAWAAELMVNPLTVTHAYQDLVNRNILQSRRGLGMFVAPNARQLLLQQERDAFLSTEWPEILKRLKHLNLRLSDLPGDLP